MRRKGEHRKLIKNNIYVNSVVSKLVYVLFSFINTILINRYLGPDLKGQYAYIMNIVNILVLVISLSIAQSYPFFFRKYGENIKQKFFNLIYCQLGIYLLIAVVLSFVFRNSNLSYILVISSMSQFNIQVIFLSIIENVRKKNMVSIVSIIFYSGLLMGLFVFANSNLQLALIAYTGFVFLNSVLLVFMNKIFPNRTRFDYKMLYEIINFSFFPMITSLLITFNYNIDVIILKQFVPYSSIGIYSLGVTLAGMLWIIPDAFKDVLFNKTAKDDSINEILFGIKFNVAVSIVIIFGFLFVGQTFIKLVYGNAFSDSYSVSVILFIGTIPMIFFKMINTLYIANGKQKTSFKILLVSVIINIVLNYLFIPRYGIIAAAISSVVSYSVCGMIMLLTFTKKYRIVINEVFFPNEKELIKIKKLLKRQGE